MPPMDVLSEPFKLEDGDTVYLLPKLYPFLTRIPLNNEEKSKGLTIALHLKLSITVSMDLIRNENVPNPDSLKIVGEEAIRLHPDVKNSDTIELKRKESLPASWGRDLPYPNPAQPQPWTAFCNQYFPDRLAPSRAGLCTHY